MARLWVLALALVPLVVAQSLTCLNAAGANGPVAALAAAAAQLSGPVAPQTGITAIFNILPQITTAYFQNFYFGLENGDAFLIKNCRLQESTNINYCGMANTPLIAYIRSDSTWGDGKRHVFPIESGGVLGTQVGITGSYDTVNRPWYLQGSVANGWTTLEQFAAGGQGRTYTNMFDGTQNGGVKGVAAWDRVTRTPCDVCMTNSWAVTAATILGASDSRKFVSVTSAGSFQELVWHLWFNLVATSRSQGSTLGVFIGMQNNDFYAVEDCWNSAHMTTQACLNSGTRYIASIRNTAIFGDQVRHAYSIATDGTITQMVGVVTGQYNTTLRPWYLLNNGWTDPYTDFSTGTTVSSYVVSIATGAYFATTQPLGVYGADTTSAEPCAGWLYTCASPSPSVSGSRTPSPTVTPTQSAPAPPVTVTAEQSAQTRSVGYGLGLGLGFGLGLPLVLVTIGILYLIATKGSAGGRRADMELYGDYDVGRKPKPAAVN